MSEVIVFPDAEQLVLDYLRPRIAAPAHSTVPDPRPDLFVTVVRVGGVRRLLTADEPILAVEAWGPSKEAAADLMATARAHLLALDNLPAVLAVREGGGPAWLPDPKSGQARYLATLQLLVSA